MSLELEHALNVGRAVVCSGDLSRAAAQLDRIRTLDVHRQRSRDIAVLAAVLAVRSQQVDQAERELAGLSPLEAAELQLLSDMLASAPEAAYPEYRRFVRRLLKKSDPVAVAGSADRRRLVLWGGAAAALAVLVAVLAAALFLRPRAEGPETALARMLDQFESGDLGGLWAGLPERFRSEGDFAFRAVMSRVPASAFDDFRTIDRGLSELVLQRRDRLSGSRVASIGPTFRTMSGEDDARALAGYLKMLSESRVYDRSWLTSEATVTEFIDGMTGGDFPTCWRTYLRRSVLDHPVWPALLGLKVDRLGAFLASTRTYAISRPDDGSGRAMVAILTSGEPDRLDVGMRFVDGKWIPETLAQWWEITTLQAKNDPAFAGELLQHLLTLRPDFELSRLDRRKLLIIEGNRAKTQEEFDERAREYFIK
jgi:hypothetical protein